MKKRALFPSTLARRAVGLAALLLFTGVAVVGAASRRVDLGDGIVVSLGDDQEPRFEAMPLAQEGLLRFAERLCGDSSAAPRISAANGRVNQLLAGVRYTVPVDLLLPQLRLRMFETLFQEDSRTTPGWRHVVRAPSGAQSETLWKIAEWFTGNGRNYGAIREFNELQDEEINLGQVLLVPNELLLPGLTLPAPTLPAPPLDLRFGSDSSGAYGLYSLKAGEALYSSVVVRFTGAIFADDVQRLAKEIAQRSGIADVTDIPVGYQVKIPEDLLQPEFLPLDHPRRLSYESERASTAGYANRVLALDLDGVTVILDAGHGGRDVGASIGGVWESTYVYDIMLRLRQLLATRTAAEVVTTTRDGGGYMLTDRDQLTASRGHKVMVTPPYTIEDSAVSANLRWYLSNSIYQDRTTQHRRDPERVVFISIHADSLHPSLRGAMVYLPGLLENPSNYGKSGTVYTSRREVRERQRVTFSRSQRVRSEGLSRDLAEKVIKSFRSKGLRVHENKPIRDRVIRNREAWVPAVLRFNEVPAKILVEVCNLANSEDRRLIQTREFRQQVAETIADALLDYYGRVRDRDIQVAGAD